MKQIVVNGVPRSLLRDGWWLDEHAKAFRSGATKGSVSQTKSAEATDK
ncbi:hypothetical protein [Marivivens aquimaris]|nr:hypothetical protein [Marivivens aquimaris]